jgi:hypothetical protein
MINIIMFIIHYIIDIITLACRFIHGGYKVLSSASTIWRLHVCLVLGRTRGKVAPHAWRLRHRKLMPRRGQGYDRWDSATPTRVIRLRESGARRAGAVSNIFFSEKRETFKVFHA